MRFARPRKPAGLTFTWRALRPRSAISTATCPRRCFHMRRTRWPSARRSAFVATGSYTNEGRVVIGHNAWTGYLDGERWTMIFDIAPSAGQRFLMDGFPGLIHSADDFGVNAAGMMITETTITRFNGW